VREARCQVPANGEAISAGWGAGTLQWSNSQDLWMKIF
jgi:hypothetical protein